MINFLHVLSVIGAIASGILLLVGPSTLGESIIPTAIGALIGFILNILFYGELKTMKSNIEENQKAQEKKNADIINHLNAAIRNINRINQESANKPTNNNDEIIIEKESTKQDTTE